MVGLYKSIITFTLYGIANVLEIDYFNYLKSHWNLDPVSVFFNLILAANKN